MSRSKNAWIEERLRPLPTPDPVPDIVHAIIELARGEWLEIELGGKKVSRQSDVVV